MDEKHRSKLYDLITSDDFTTVLQGLSLLDNLVASISDLNSFLNLETTPEH